MGSVSEIAAGLTKAQREALVAARETVDGRVLVDAGPVLAGAHSTWPQGVCRYYSARRDVLTKTGLAVRQHLLESAGS